MEFWYIIFLMNTQIKQTRRKQMYHLRDIWNSLENMEPRSTKPELRNLIMSLMEKISIHTLFAREFLS